MAQDLLKRTPSNCALRDALRRENYVRICAASGGETDDTLDNTTTDTTVTLAQVLDSQQYLEEEARSTISATEDERVCTFELGYHDQSIFACKECSAAAKREFGFCYACSMHCHVDHTVYELFCKRNQRCDCGTVNSAGCECILADADTKQLKAATTNSDNTVCLSLSLARCVCV
jgi:hypothetical protein